MTKLELNLSVGQEVWQRDFVAYSLPERWASTSATAWTVRIPLPTIAIPNDEFGHEVGRKRRIDAGARSAFAWRPIAATTTPGALGIAPSPGGRFRTPTGHRYRGDRYSWGLRCRVCRTNAHRGLAAPSAT
jgi:hypothetical protein